MCYLVSNILQTNSKIHSTLESHFWGGVVLMAVRFSMKPKQTIFFLYDFTSLYPFVNKFGKYPLGHPRIIHSNFLPIERIFGLVQCKITPPKNLYHPVLPYRSSGKLAFPLCAACAESLNQNPCRHNDSEQRLKACRCLKS